MSKKRILIVDDEERNTQPLKSLLEKTGKYEVEVENDATKAVAKTQGFHPDLVLLDVLMPKLDGGQVAAQIRADPGLRKTPIVFVTGMVPKEEEVLSPGDLSGYPFIAKPIRIEEAIDVIEANTSKKKKSQPKV